MKFGEELTSHLTPEWRKQYIDYEHLKKLLYEYMLEIPTEPEQREAYYAQIDESFFNECSKELTKINLFFSQQLALSQGKFHELQAEIKNYTETVQNIGRGNTRQEKLQKQHAKTREQLLLAASEFYLHICLVQSFQQLNSTGFRKIMKKHDKLFMNENGMQWRINNVEKSTLFLNRDIETIINAVQSDVIDLMGGDRQAAMKRLKVPPLSEKQKPSTTFALGVALGIAAVLAFVILFSCLYSSPANRPKWVAIRLFRGPLLIFLLTFLCGLNMYGWAQAGVNHVLIFEVDPRNHLTYQDIMLIACGHIIIWELCVLSYLYAEYLHIPPFFPPLLLMTLCLSYAFCPVKKPKTFSHIDSRFWLLRHCFHCFTAPMHFVTFADFWLGDQMNSLVTAFQDLQYFVCFYVSEVDYSNWWMEPRTLNATEGTAIPWGYVDMKTGKDMCMSASGIRSLVAIVPATVRFLQCLRRYHDTKKVHPHLVNAGKYATTYLTVALGGVTKWAERTDPNNTSFFFYLWIVSYLFSFTYTFLWDAFMDWGLIDPKAPQSAPFLREEMIYGSKWYYYFAIIQDFALRLSWVMNVSLGEAWTLETDLLMCITAPLEVFRRFIWNYLRLENEHVNNCGQFRAVRDISVKPIMKGDLETLIAKMDHDNGVTHRGKELQTSVKRVKKIAKATRQLLPKTKFTPISLNMSALAAETEM